MRDRIEGVEKTLEAKDVGLPTARKKKESEDLNKFSLQARSAGKPKRSLSSNRDEESSLTGKKQLPHTEVLISVSSTIANSNGIHLSAQHLSSSLNEDTGEVLINIIDNETGKIIRQVPPDEILKVGEIQGLLLYRKNLNS